jgi:hypothetical protein
MDFKKQHRVQYQKKNYIIQNETRKNQFKNL